MEQTPPDDVDLRSVGWQQGDLLPAVSWSVNYLPTNPVTELSRAFGLSMHSGTSTGSPIHAVATGVPDQTHYFVIASQTCDVIKSIEQEPVVFVMGAVVMDDPKILAEANSNSVRFFLLDPARNLVVDATVMAVIEKPLLSTLERKQGAPDDTVQRAFGRWLARRFGRPPLPDPVENHVVRPIGQRIRKTRGTNGNLGKALRKVREIRFRRLFGDPPYKVTLLFVVDAEHRDEVSGPLAEFIRKMNDSLAKDGKAHIVEWIPTDLFSISAGNMAQTDVIYLEDVSYVKGNVVGDMPAEGDDEEWE